MSQVKIFLDESEHPDAATGTTWWQTCRTRPRHRSARTENQSVLTLSRQPFPGPIIEQEVSRERWIPIPRPVREIYRLWRPTPLYRALRLEEALGTPARIYYKYEGV